MQKYKVYINKDCKFITDNWNEFCERHTLVEAAGGVVYNSNNQVLMIFRNDKWDLPKGKLEIGETIQECALREVEEECGVSDLQIFQKLICTYHVYDLDSSLMLKRTHWFKMNTKCSNTPVPQIKEGITKAEWVSKKDLSKKLRNTYGSIKDLLGYE